MIGVNIKNKKIVWSGFGGIKPNFVYFIRRMNTHEPKTLSAAWNGKRVNDI